ncbi:hypothetical protein PENARI_c039G08204 [Penicillium arizonense]|uniref:Uncharacterized protein n=1 Tax=Penicillium arizonense TaxID=1835702 RepID=A0A1F5L333_PENAI|nr:hypothetical protein PENARI_c039G08204 [Penicillium arizonense]OGE47638.1 hypothetical protein PENARI_c039G08204 [Penicillium arizonense]
MTEFRDHCRKMCNKTHGGLMATDEGTFFPSYLGAMKRKKVKDPLSGRLRRGPPSFHQYLSIGYVIQEKVFGTPIEQNISGEAGTSN